ncbi:hypothetical protein MettiDRAFT_0836 [Methanolobus tindarius DSM 2278]|jgi:hypothetical protein|uniref:Uncharacterized protein n=1 Tax=Methanolobus tindarius DSM 2278 TaxID=1090322 RepID=W9DUP9_METTI|nr:hypothetical protein [Methanolobus tindarius]ETA67412.1 hypothetical protein MettiDRAFT_0836 [Methanolobus tindarius DSM 2278]
MNLIKWAKNKWDSFLKKEINNQYILIGHLLSTFISIGFAINQYFHAAYYSRVGTEIQTAFDLISKNHHYSMIPNESACFLAFFILAIYFVILEITVRRVLSSDALKYWIQATFVSAILIMLSQFASKSLITLWLNSAILLVGFGALFVTNQYGKNTLHNSIELKLLYDEVKGFIHVSTSFFSAVLISSGFAFVAFIYGTKYPNEKANWFLIIFYASMLLYISIGFLVGIIGQLYIHLIEIRQEIENREIKKKLEDCIHPIPIYVEKFLD